MFEGGKMRLNLANNLDTIRDIYEMSQSVTNKNTTIIKYLWDTGEKCNKDFKSPWNLIGYIEQIMSIELEIEEVEYEGIKIPKNTFIVVLNRFRTKSLKF